MNALLHTIKKSVTIAAVTLVLGLAGMAGYVAVLEDSFIYLPSRTLTATPADAGLAYETREFGTTDGVRLHGWYIPHPAARYTVLHCHGNAGNIGHRVRLYRRLHDLGLAVFGFDYRGYGKSDGKPSEAGLYLDVRAAWAELTSTPGIRPPSVIIVGRSLGSGPATQLATEVGAAALVLETPFTSVPRLARTLYPLLPTQLLLRTRFDNLAKMADVGLPLLILHGDRDEVIPAAMGRALFDAAHEPKTWHLLRGGHNDFDVVSEPRYVAAWREFVAALPDARQSTAFEQR